MARNIIYAIHRLAVPYREKKCPEVLSTCVVFSSKIDADVNWAMMNESVVFLVGDVYFCALIAIMKLCKWN